MTSILTKHLQSCLLAVLCLGAIASVPVNAQDGTTQVPVTTLTNQTPHWKQLAEQILQLTGNQSFGGRNMSEAQEKVFKETLDLYQKLGDLSPQENVSAYRYISEKSSNPEVQYKNAFSILYSEPTADNVRFVLPYFDKFNDRQKIQFLSPLVFDSILLRPSVPEFHAFPDVVLEQAAQDIKLSEDLVSKAAVVVANRATAQEKQWMHRALSHNLESSGLWNTLTQLNDFTPAEVQKARQMFAAKQQQSGWRITLAAALSPYDPKMREVVRQTVEDQITKYANTQQWPQSLMVLRIWEIDQARPFLLRMLSVKNNEMRHFALPLLAMRAPQELLRVAQQPDAKEKVHKLQHSLALMTLFYPQYKPQASQIMVKLQGLPVYPEDNPREMADEIYSLVLKELQNVGIEEFDL